MRDLQNALDAHAAMTNPVFKRVRGKFVATYRFNGEEVTTMPEESRYLILRRLARKARKGKGK